MEDLLVRRCNPSLEAAVIPALGIFAWEAFSRIFYFYISSSHFSLSLFFFFFLLTASISFLKSFAGC